VQRLPGHWEPGEEFHGDAGHGDEGFNHLLDTGEGATFCAVAASLVRNLQIIAGNGLFL